MILCLIKNFLEQSGYKLQLFNSLFDDNIEIKELTYETQVNIKKSFDIKENMKAKKFLGMTFQQ